MARHSSTRPSRLTRLLAGLLAFVFVVLPAVPAQALYHCQVTEETNTKCCCLDTGCCEAAPAEAKGCCPSSEPSPDGPAAEASCNCCDVSYVSFELGAAAHLRAEDSSAPKFAPHFLALPQGMSVGTYSPALSGALPPDSAKGPRAGPAVYLLHCSFLI